VKNILMILRIFFFTIKNVLIYGRVPWMLKVKCQIRNLHFQECNNSVYEINVLHIQSK